MTRAHINIPDDVTPRLVLSLDVELSDDEKARLRAAFPQPTPADLEHWQAQAASCKEIADHLWSIVRRARAAGEAVTIDRPAQRLAAVLDILKEADH